MTTAETTTVESFSDDRYHRFYVPYELRTDSRYKLAGGQEVSLRVIGPGLLVMPKRRTQLAETIVDVVDEEVL